MMSDMDAVGLSRRAFLVRSGLGLGALALDVLSHQEAEASNALGAFSRVLPPKVKSVIFLHMVGAPSQLDLFDYKPELIRFDRQLAPKSFVEGKRFAFLRGHPKLLGTPYQFDQHGQGGAWISELLPRLATVSDEICFIKSMRTNEFNHGPAQLLAHTGINRGGNPSLGSWVNYGLGSVGENLPGYVVFLSGVLPGGGRSLWSNGFLPSINQGVEFRSQGEPVLFLNDPPGVDKARRRRILDGIQSLNLSRYDVSPDREIQTRMNQYELAFKMQSSVPELMDLSNEPASVLSLYGDGEFAKHCLYARRLVERGTRFVELFNASWDTHGNQDRQLHENCRRVDGAITGLLTDLKQRGLLDETLVVWASEFGRTPMLQGNESPEKCGRDHHKEAFTIWMAGGGVKGGMTYGSTDEMGYWIDENPVKFRDLHATLFHLLGMDHRKAVYRHQGLDQRLTGVEDDARVLSSLLT
jgi:hypothetical protein